MCDRKLLITDVLTKEKALQLAIVTRYKVMLVSLISLYLIRLFNKFNYFALSYQHTFRSVLKSLLKYCKKVIYNYLINKYLKILEAKIYSITLLWRLLLRKSWTIIIEFRFSTSLYFMYFSEMTSQYIKYTSVLRYL